MAATAFASPIEITYWSVFTGADGATMQSMVDAFNDSQDEVRVIHTPMTADDLYTRIPLAVLTGAGVPTVAIVHIERIPMFIQQGLIDPIDFLMEHGIYEENYIPSAWERASIDGFQWGVPLDVHSFISYVNLDLFEEFDLMEFLEDGYITFDEVRELGTRARENGFEGTIMGLTWQRALLLSFYAQLNGELTDEEGRYPTFNNEDMYKVLQTMRDLHADGFTSVQGDDTLMDFHAGNMLIWPEGIWMMAGVVDAGINFQMLPSVTFAPEITRNWTSSHIFVQFVCDDRTEEEDIALAKFINFMGENSFVWAYYAGQVPAHVSINDIEEFVDMPQAFLADPERGDELFIYSYLFWGLFDTAFTRNGWEAVWGLMSIEDFLNQAEQEVIDAIAQQ